MSERVCILHHLEEDFQEGLRKFGTSFEELAEKVVDYLEHEQFDRVILVRWEDFRIGPEHELHGLSRYIDQVESYAWGWEREEMKMQYPDGEGSVWAEGCPHSEVVMLDDWMKALKGKDVTLTGAFEHECIDTVSTALGHCGVEFKREEGLIVGSCVDYEFRGSRKVDPDELRDTIQYEAEQHYEVNIKSASEAREALLELILTSTAETISDQDTVDKACDRVFGFCQGDKVCLDDDELLEVDPDLYNDIEPLELSEVDEDEPEAIQVTFVNGLFRVSEEDYPRLKLYRDLAAQPIPVLVDAVEVSPFEYSGLKWDSDAGFEKLQSAARRITTRCEAQPTPGSP